MASKTSNWKLTGQVIDCAMKVHSELGSGFQEAVYQRALGSEMMRAGVVFRREVDLPIIYKGQQVGMRRVDFLVADAVMLEIKAVAELNDTHLTQAILFRRARTPTWSGYQLRRRQSRYSARLQPNQNDEPPTVGEPGF